MPDAPHRTAVITGCGALSPLGKDVPAFWNGLLAGRSGLDSIRSFDASAHAHAKAGEVKDFDPERDLSPEDSRGLDRITQYALMAAREAISDAGLDLARADRTRIGVILATTLG